MLKERMISFKKGEEREVKRELRGTCYRKREGGLQGGDIYVGGWLGVGGEGVRGRQCQ